MRAVEGMLTGKSCYRCVQDDMQYSSLYCLYSQPLPLRQLSYVCRCFTPELTLGCGPVKGLEHLSLGRMETI